MIISIPTECLTYIGDAKPKRLPNHWKWNNKKEYSAWWYQQNRERVKAKILKRYHEKKNQN